MKGILIAVAVAIIAIGVLYYLMPTNPTENPSKPIEEPKTPEPKPKPIEKMVNGEAIEEGKELTLPELFELVKDSVVKISIRGTLAQGIGSGFVYSDEGYIITNNHVIADADRITVTFPDGVSYKADIIGRDPYTDLAVIKVDAPKDKLKPLKLGDSSRLKVGEQVAAIGNPFGLSSSMTSGIISQLGRLLDVPNAGGFVIPDVIQTDAAINPGNSGGPLLNMRGEVIGVNTAILSRTGEFVGIGFAIPSNTVKKVVPVLIEKGRFEHPWLGVSGSNITPELAEVLGLKEAKGFLVMDVVSNSPADKAGIRGGDREIVIDGRRYVIGGDIIVAIDGIDVRGIEDILIYLQREKNVGDDIMLRILRDEQEVEITVKLGARPQFEP